MKLSENRGSHNKRLLRLQGQTAGLSPAGLVSGPCLCNSRILTSAFFGPHGHLLHSVKMSQWPAFHRQRAQKGLASKPFRSSTCSANSIRQVAPASLAQASEVEIEFGTRVLGFALARPVLMLSKASSWLG